MKSLMRYKIISGRVVEKRDALLDISLDPTSQKPRGKRGSYRGKSGAAQIERNCKEAERRLGRSINCNFETGDLFLSLKYDDLRLPESREAADNNLTNLMRWLARKYKKATGKKLKWVGVTADTSSKTGLPVRLHHHAVIPKMDIELIYQVWPADQVTIRHLDGRGDYSGIARYMLTNAGYRRHKRTWRSSNGLDKPVFTAPEPVRSGAGSFRVPRQAVVMEREVREDADSGFSAAYIRYVMPQTAGAKSAEKRYNTRGDFSRAKSAAQKPFSSSASGSEMKTPQTLANKATGGIKRARQKI